MHDRLATIATTLRLQDATGTSHLQQLEMNPEAYGVANSARPQVKSLRLQRNRALHGTTSGGEPPLPHRGHRGGRCRPANDPSSHSGSPHHGSRSNISGSTPGSEVASTTAKTLFVKTAGNISQTTPASEVASTTAKTLSATTTGNISAASSRPHSTGAGASHRRPSHEEVPDEIVDYLDPPEQQADPAYLTTISYQGRNVLIDGIGYGTQSGAKLYRIHIYGTSRHLRVRHVTSEYVLANPEER